MANQCRLASNSAKAMLDALVDLIDGGGADRRARIASRVMGLAIAGLSLAVAGYGVARFFSPAVAGWGDGRELALGFAVLLAVAASYFAARIHARAPAVGSRDAAR